MIDNYNYLGLKEDGVKQTFENPYSFCIAALTQLHTQFPRGYIHVGLYLEKCCGTDKETLRGIMKRCYFSRIALRAQVGRCDPYLFKVDWQWYGETHELCEILESLCMAVSLDAPSKEIIKMAVLNFLHDIK